MNALTIAFVGVVLAIGIYSLLTAPKRIAVPFVIVLYLGIYVGFADLLGQSKPILIPDDEMTVIGFYFDEGRAIHVWVLEEEPRAYRLPWDIEQAKKLRRAAQQAEGEAGNLVMRRGVPEGEAMFYTLPPQEPPPK